jgi:signal transduction histidine kinase
MHRVFNNLINNAIQAIPDGRSGVVTVEVNLNGNNRYRIKIKDNGIGIPEDKKENIFRPNFTTKTGGTGLGLAMSKNIIESSGGKIWFETEVDQGTTFFIELPKLN